MSSCSVMPMAWTMAPSIWPRALSGLITRPASTTATYFVMWTSPRAVSTSTSTKCAPKAERTLPAAIAGRLRLPPRLPLERARAAVEAFLESEIGERRAVARPRHVPADEFHGIDAELVRDVVHHRLDAEEPLRELGRAEVARHGP